MLATICNSDEVERAVAGGGKHATDCCRVGVLACIACASDCRNTNDALYWSHMHNKLIEGPDSHSTKSEVNLDKVRILVLYLLC